MNRIRSKKRLTICFTVIGLFMLICLIRAAVLSEKNGTEFEKQALREAAGRSETILSRPGSIIDRNGVGLAVSKKVYRLILDPSVMLEEEKKAAGTVETTLNIISDVFGLDYTGLKSFVEEHQELAYYRVMEDKVLSEDEKQRYEAAVDAFETEKKDHNKEAEKSDKDDILPIRARIEGVWFEEEYRRDYPLNDAFSKIIGFRTKDTTEGILGLEHYYSDDLLGTDGKRYSYIDEDGNTATQITEPVNGYTLKTSLDANVSAVLKNAIERFKEETGGKRICVLCMDPNNGEILGIESDTEFDLNDPTNLENLFTEEELKDPAKTYLLQEAYKNDPDALESMDTKEKQEKLLQLVEQNFAVSGTFEPGSTAKSLTLSAGIEEGIIDPDETFYCDGEIGVSSYKIHCHMDTLCGDLTPMEALGRSCNVCYVRIGQKIGSSVFAKYQEIFNIGQKTGIDLPGEADTSRLIYYEDGLHETELSTCAFGQGFNVTMVQLASAYASIVNGGYYYQPHVVTAILDDRGNTVKEVEPLLLRRTVSEKTSEYMKEALRYVTTFGTATYAPTEGYTLGGKTGASEKLPRGTGKYVVSFIGAVPIESPKFLLYAVVDEPNAEDQSMSRPAQELAHYCYEGLYAYFGIYPEEAEDAYSYDWGSLKDSSADGEGSGKGSFIEDPDGKIQWLE